MPDFSPLSEPAAITELGKLAPLSSPRIPPDPAGQPDNRWLRTQGGQYQLTDPPATTGDGTVPPVTEEDAGKAFLVDNTGAVALVGGIAFLFQDAPGAAIPARPNVPRAWWWLYDQPTASTGLATNDIVTDQSGTWTVS